MEQTILTRLLEIVVYSTAIFLIVWLFRTAFSKWLSPTLKYALWFLVILRLCIPVTLESSVHLFTLPQSAVPTASVSPVSTVAPVEAGVSTAAPLLDGGTNPAGAQTHESDGASSPEAARNVLRTLNWRQWLLVAWAAGFLAMLGVSVGLMVQLGMRTRRLGCEPGGKTQALYEDVKQRMHIHGRIPILLMPDISSPALTVEPRPKLLMPDQLIYAASAESMAFAMAHELMHYKRGDYLVCLLLLLLRAVYWFHPVSWLLMHMMRLDMETACDAMVVARFDRAQKLSYVNLLLSLGEESSQATLHLKGGE
jgi:beta-lactamase regulating signal transducer with metallopeptidase domain